MVLELVSFYNMPRYISCYLSCITQQPKVLSINPYSSGLCKFVFNSLHFPNNPCILSFFAKMNAMLCSMIPSQLETQVVILAGRSMSLIVPASHMDGSQFSSVQSPSCVRLFATAWIAACQASLSITNSRSLPKLTSIESVMPSSHLILCRPLLLLPLTAPSIRVFSNESTFRMRWLNYWNFSFSIIPSKETPGLISFRMDWLDLLAVQGTRKSLLQHHSSKASVLQLSSQSNSHFHTWPQEKP